MNPLTKFFTNLLPRRHVTRWLDRHQPASTLPGLSVDRLGAAIRNAEGGDTRGLFAVYRDCVLADCWVQSLLGARKMAALKDALVFSPKDKSAAEDVAAAQFADRFFLSGYNAADEEIDDWQLALATLLDGVLWPVAVVSKRFAPSRLAGVRWDLAGLKLVDPQLLDWGGEGCLRIAETGATGERLEQFHAVDPARYLKHQGHLLTVPGNWGGPMRAILFWWLFATMNRDWWVRFLDRFGAPFLKGSYDAGDDQSRTELEAAFAASSRLLGVVVSKETEVDVVSVQGGNATGEAFERFRNVARREIAIAILGQNLSSESAPTGMNSGTSDLQGAVLRALTDFDQGRLAMTLGRTLRQWLVINGHFGAVEVMFGGKPAGDVEKIGQAMAHFASAGLTVSDEALPELSAAAGFALVRTPPTTSGPAAVQPLSADPFEVRPAAAAALARQTRDDLAGMVRLLGRPDQEARLAEFFARLDANQRAGLVESVLVAAAAAGVE